MALPSKKELTKIGQDIYNVAISAKTLVITTNSLKVAKAVNEFKLALEQLAFDTIVEAAKQKQIYGDPRSFKIFLELISDPKENIRSLPGNPFKNLPFEVEDMWGEVLAKQAEKIMKGMVGSKE